MPSVNYKTYVPARPITFNPAPILSVIEHRMERVVSTNIHKAMRVALGKVPVRKVFTGGRQRTRPLSFQEIAAEADSFVGISPSNRMRVGPFSPMTRFLGSDAHPNWRARAGTRVVTHRNKANTWRNTQYDRQVMPILSEDRRRDSLPDLIRFSEGNPNWQMVGDLAAYGLNVHGRRYLETGRVEQRNTGEYFASRHGNYAIAVWGNRRKPSFTLGGNLRRSLRIEPPVKDLHMKVIAGDEEAPYAKYVEFGTRHAPAQPFLRPAFASVEEKFINDVIAALHELEGKYPVR